MKLKSWFSLTFIFYFFLSPSPSFPNISYQNQVDKSLTILSLSVLPITDNVGNIYARPIQKHLTHLIQSSHRWRFLEHNIVGPIFSPKELEHNTARIKNILKILKADGFIVVGIMKRPEGIALTLNLYSKPDHHLLLQEREKNFQHFEIIKVVEKAGKMFQELMSHLPYRGLVLSRQNQSVTLDLGKKDGVEKNQILSVGQIVKVVRHPQFHFLIHTEKEVLGHVKLIKVEETLSFGKIIWEKERHSTRKHLKILNITPAPLSAHTTHTTTL